MVTVTCDETLGSRLCDSGDDGDDPGFLTGFSLGTGVFLKWCRGYFFGVRFVDSFSVHGDYDKCHFFSMSLT